MFESSQSLIDQLWDFNDPSSCELRFRAACDVADDATAMELRTQIARALGLQRRFDDAHRVLDEIEREMQPQPADARLCAARVRLLLERGRVFNSSKRADQAMPVFERAWTIAEANSDLDVLAIDAAHMIAIVHHNAARTDDALTWNRLAIERADNSLLPRARQWGASLHNNIAWALHDRGEFDAALAHFDKALVGRIAQNRPSETRIARWCVGRCLRSLGRIDEALASQRRLFNEVTTTGDLPDGFLHEELAECLHALGRETEAQPHFASAHEILARDQCLCEREPRRIERLGLLAHAN